MRTLFRLLLLALVATLGACAHPISLAPDLSQLEDPKAPPRPRTVGLHLPSEDKSLQVTTPGGGGDNVSYYPYRDLEGGLYKVLRNTYERVVVISDPKDIASLTRNNITLVARPKITTQSSSDSPFTWPPTLFQVQLSYVFSDILGSRICEVFVTGVGKAEYSEFISDFSLSAKRASLDALQKAQRAVIDEKTLK